MWTAGVWVIIATRRCGHHGRHKMWAVNTVSQSLWQRELNCTQRPQHYALRAAIPQYYVRHCWQYELPHSVHWRQMTVTNYYRAQLSAVNWTASNCEDTLRQATVCHALTKHCCTPTQHSKTFTQLTLLPSAGLEIRFGEAESYPPWQRQQQKLVIIAGRTKWLNHDSLSSASVIHEGNPTMIHYHLRQSTQLHSYTSFQADITTVNIIYSVAQYWQPTSVVIVRHRQCWSPTPRRMTANDE